MFLDKACVGTKAFLVSYVLLIRIGCALLFSFEPLVGDVLQESSVLNTAFTIQFISGQYKLEPWLLLKKNTE